MRRSATDAFRTRRLVLRPTAPEDAVDLLAHWRDPDVRRFLWDDELVEPETVDAVIAQSTSDHATHGWGGWTVRSYGSNPSTEPVIGWCGLRVSPLDGSAVTDLSGSTTDLVELIYSLSPLVWGRGLAVEASTSVLDRSLATDTLAEVWGGTDAPNVRSIATLERLGFVFVREVLLDVGPTPYFRLTKAGWSRRASSLPAPSDRPEHWERLTR